MNLSIVCIMRDERPYILEWVAYHRAVGVKHITVYDNKSKDGSSELLAGLDQLGVLRHEPWPATGEASPQIAAYRHYKRHFADSSRWALFIDADEFAVPVIHESLEAALSSILEHAPDARAIALNWKTFGTSGRDRFEPGLVMERFQQCADGGTPPNNCVKSAVSLMALEEPHIHVHKISSGKYINEHGLDAAIYGNGMSQTASHDIVQINHYMTKSVEEWQSKKARGNANLSDDHNQKYQRLNDELFLRANRNEATCRRILRYLPVVQMEISRLQKCLAELS